MTDKSVVHVQHCYCSIVVFLEDERGSSSTEVAFANLNLVVGHLLLEVLDEEQPLGVYDRWI